VQSIGVVRKLDQLGRIVIPMELRKSLDIQQKDDIEIFVSSEGIVLRKYHPVCVFCGESEDVLSVQDKLVCKHCLSELKSL
jgi:AbrB family transcriptional regulator, transcriptional pleiotropic regulator of transition state genes